MYSLDFITINNTLYHAILVANTGIYLYDLDWNNRISIITYGSIPKAFYMIVINNQFYFSCQTTYGLITTTSSLSSIKTYNSQIGSYRQMTYNSANQTILIANYIGSSIDTFDTSFNFLSSISLPYQPYGVNFYGSKIFGKIITKLIFKSKYKL
jgi:hypothetical protein